MWEELRPSFAAAYGLKIMHDVAVLACVALGWVFSSSDVVGTLRPWPVLSQWEQGFQPLVGYAKQSF